MKQAYYARSLLLRDSEKEKEQLALLEIMYEVVNPSLEKVVDEALIMKKCLELVANCDVVVFTDVDGFVSKGVYTEVKFAISKGIRVEYLKENEFVENWKLVMNDEKDWKFKYSKVGVIEIKS